MRCVQQLLPLFLGSCMGVRLNCRLLLVSRDELPATFLDPTFLDLDLHTGQL